MKNSLAFVFLFACAVPAFAGKMTATDYVRKAESAFNDKSYKKCISYTEKALDRDPSLADAYFWKARALEAQGKSLEAANEYHAAILAKPDFQAAQEGLTRVSTVLGTEKPAVSSE